MQHFSGESIQVGLIRNIYTVVTIKREIFASSYFSQKFEVCEVFSQFGKLLLWNSWSLWLQSPVLTAFGSVFFDLFHLVKINFLLLHLTDCFSFFIEGMFALMLQSEYTTSCFLWQKVLYDTTCISSVQVTSKQDTIFILFPEQSFYSTVCV